MADGNGVFQRDTLYFPCGRPQKNVADRLFNSLKQDYWKQNLLTFDKLVRKLDKSLSLIIHPTVAEDFLNYSKLLDSLHWPLTGNIKTNHISLAQTMVHILQSGRAISRSTRSVSSTFRRGVIGME
jgi:hypothetical protein